MFAGAPGFYDSWLRERSCLGGEAWSELGWHAFMSSGCELPGNDMYGYDDIVMLGAEAARNETGSVVCWTPGLFIFQRKIKIIACILVPEWFGEGSYINYNFSPQK